MSPPLRAPGRFVLNGAGRHPLPGLNQHQRIAVKNADANFSFGQVGVPDFYPEMVGQTEKLRIRQDLFMLDQLAQLVKETADEIYRLSVTQPWVQQVPYLIQLTGIGALTAMTILSAIGDIERFPSAKKLVGYAGLGARIHASGLTHKSGAASPNKVAKNCAPP